jgi:hypothetical protein
MTDTKDIILAMLEKQWSQAQQSENQRAAMTNYVLLIYGGLQSFIVQRGFDHASAVLAGVMVLVGAWGALASAKYYERFRLSTCRIGRWMEKLEQLDQASDLDAIEKRADGIHKTRYPRLHKIRLHSIWNWLHIGVIIAGLLNAGVLWIKW